MSWALTAVLCVLLVELALRLPFGGALSGVSKAGMKAMRVLRSKAVSDHWKEKAMGAYARTTFLSTAKLAGLLAVFLAVAAALVVAFNQGQDGFQDFILGWQGLAASLIFASVYFTLRRKFGN